MPFGVVNGIPLLFIHIPKTAGTSIKEYFNLQIAGHETLHDALYALEQGVVPVHANEEYSQNITEGHRWKTSLDNAAIQMFKEAHHQKVHPIAKWFKFCFVRNPWDRMASMYHYHYHDFGGLGSFDEMIEDMRRHQGPIFDPSSDVQLRLTQTQFISVGDTTEQVSPLSPNPFFTGRHPVRDTPNTMMIDYLGRYESLHRDVKEICRHLDENCQGSDTYWKNHRGAFTARARPSKNSRQRYTKMYTTFNLIYAVFQYYYEDVVNFNYTFSGHPNCEITKECFKIRAKNVTQSL